LKFRLQYYGITAEFQKRFLVILIRGLLLGGFISSWIELIKLD